MLAGKPPFNGNDPTTIQGKIKNGNLRLRKKNFENVSTEAKEFLKQLCSFDPKDRPTAEEALLNPWLSDHSLFYENGFNRESEK